MGAALRGNGLRGIGSSAAEVVFAVGAGAKVSGIAVGAELYSCLEGVGAGGEGDILPALKEVAIGLHDGTGGGVEGLKKSIVELDRGVSVVRGRKAGRGARDADGRFESKARRDGARVGSYDVALTINILNTESLIDGGLIGIGGGAGEVIEIEAGKELVFGRDLVVETQGELNGIRGDFGCGCVGVGLIRAGGIVGQRIAGQHGGNSRIDRHGEGIDGAVGISDGVKAGALCHGGHGHDLRGSQHLAKGLRLDEVKGALAAVVEMRNEDGAAVGESELVAAEGRNAAWISGRRVVKIVAGVKGGVADKLEEGPVKSAGSGAGDDVGKPGSAAADVCGHPSGTGIDSLDRVDVEVGEGGPAHLWIADVGAVHRKCGLNAALAVDGELLGKVGGAVGVRHGAGG